MSINYSMKENKWKKVIEKKFEPISVSIVIKINKP